MEPANVDQVRDRLETEDVPEFKKLDGFRGFVCLVDRKQGKVVGTSFWQTDDQMKNSEEAVTGALVRAAERGGAESEPVTERFEVALDVFIPRPQRK
jgi:heme-degrading monooxygenase HmoA